tara:strand:+ start:252 stop:500 length:249 start_codon:yes stop_codon:yes gene_type:complete
MASCCAVDDSGRGAPDHFRKHFAVMSFGQELLYFLRRGLHLQYQEGGIETPVYYKRTHGSRTDVMQGIDVLRAYSFSFEDGR